MSTHSQKSKSSPWQQTSVHFRLTAKRRTALQSLFPEGQPLPNPTKAIDQVIEWLGQVTTNNSAAMRDQINAMQDRIEKMTEKQDAQFEDTRASLANLFQLISGAVAADGDSDESFLLKDWLTEEVRSQRLKVEKFVLARLTWTGTRRIKPGQISLNFEAEIRGCDGQAIDHPAPPHPIRIEAISESDPLNTTDARKSLYAVCQPMSNQGWQVTLYVAQANGTTGEKLGVYRF